MGTTLSMLRALYRYSLYLCSAPFTMRCNDAKCTLYSYGIDHSETIDSIRMLYAELILPLAVEGRFHYRVPPELEGSIAVGMRAVLPFGSRRFYTGIVVGLSSEAPAIKQGLKEISYLPDAYPLVSAELLARWVWIADYYLCTLGEVLIAAMPRGLLPESRSMIYLSDGFEAEQRLSLREQAMLDCVAANQGKAISLATVEKLLGGGSLANTLSKLIAMGALTVEEKLQRRYKVKELPMLRLAKPYQSDEALSVLIDSIARAPKQQAFLLRFAELLDLAGLDLSASLSRKQVCDDASNHAAMIKALKERGVIEEYLVPTSRLAEELESVQTNEYPDAALQAARLRSECQSAGTYLLSSKDYKQKEAVLLELIVREVEAGHRVVLLSPTANRMEDREGLACRLADRLGSRFYNYHALRSDAEKVEIWQRLSQSDEAYLLMGMRAAVLLPCHDPSLLIVDAEHEYIYKQQDPAPRFHARDVAIWVANTAKCPIILASETPSAESLLHLKRGKYRPLTLEGGQPMQQFEIETLDMKLMQRQRRISFQERLSPPLLQALEATVQAGQMSLVLQNRRGFAPQVVCQACAAPIRCVHCDVSLSYHKASRTLLCHYCDYRQPVPQLCPACKARDPQSHGTTLRAVGYGVERIEDELKARLPHARIVRIDSDSVRSKKNRTLIEDRLSEGDVDILVGTQLIKGQNYGSNVGLIAVVELDSILAYPDFRSYERAFQLLYQLLIRSGAGRMILQTMNPDNPFIAQLANASYQEFITQQLGERQLLHFPPFCRLISLRLKAPEAAPLDSFALELSLRLRDLMPDCDVSDPIRPPVARFQSFEHRQLLIKAAHRISSVLLRRQLKRVIEETRTIDTHYKRISIQFDVDPQ